MAFDPGTLEAPQTSPICVHQYNAGVIKQALLDWGHLLVRVAKHAHGLYHGEGLSGIEFDVLPKQEFTIKEKAQIPPNWLGLEGGGPGE